MHLAPQDHAAAVGVDSPFVEKRGQRRAVGCFEHAFDNRLVRSGAHHIAPSALAEQES